MTTAARPETARHMAALSTEHCHELALGLDGGADGIAVVNRIIDGASSYLTEKGVLVIEVGESAGAFEQRCSFPFVRSKAGPNHLDCHVPDDVSPTTGAGRARHPGRGPADFGLV